MHNLPCLVSVFICNYFLEVNLGLFVDNSATYYFPKLPYNFGKFLATTGTTVKGKDLVKLGLADYYIKKWLT